MRTPRSARAKRRRRARARTRGEAEPERSTRPASSALSESEDPPPPRGEPPSPYIGFSNDSSCGSDGALERPVGTGGGAASAAAAARAAASAAAWGTARHASTKCAATSGASPKCRRAYDATTLRQAYPSTRPMPGTSFARRGASADSMARTAARTTPSFETFSSISAFEDVVSGRVPRSFSSSPARNTSYAANQRPPREGVSPSPPFWVPQTVPGPAASAGSATTADRRRAYPRRSDPAGNSGHPSRATTRTYPHRCVSFKETRVEKGARPHMAAFPKATSRDPSSMLCDRNAKPPPRRTPRRRRRRTPSRRL